MAPAQSSSLRKGVKKRPEGSSQPNRANPPEEAIALLKKNVEKGATIVGIGPFTNLHLLAKEFPGILKEANLFLIGGYVYPVIPGFPNWKNEFDFNVQVDIKSAKYVLEHSNPTLVPLSVTAETALRRAYLPKLRTAGALGQLLALQAEVFAADEKMETKYGSTCERLPSDIINFLHDPLACAIALGWDQGVEIAEVPLAFEEKDGWLHERIDSRGQSTRVVTKIDGPRFGEFWLHRITNG